MRKLSNPELKLTDLIWLIFYIINYSFNVSIDNMQMGSVIALFALSVIPFFALKLHEFKWKEVMDCTIWYGLFYIWVCISKFWTATAGIEVNNTAASLIQLFVFYICFDWYVRTEREVSVIIKCFCYASFVFAVVTLVTSPLSTYMTEAFGAYTGMQRNTTGYILMFGCIFDLFYGRQINKGYYKIMAVVCFFSSLCTGSRKIIIGYVLAVMLFVLWQKKVTKTTKYIILISISAMTIIPLAYKIPIIRETFGERLFAIFDDSISDGSVAARERARDLAILLFKEKPIIGNGWNAVTSRYANFYGKAFGLYAHNNYLEVAADFGIIGVVLFYWKFVYSFCDCIKYVRKNKYACIVCIALAVTLLLDYGQITYCYIYMMTIFGIIFKIQKIMFNKSDVIE